MKATKAKKEFKKRFGNANHLLITALVGLDAIESGLVKDKPESFSTSWSPRDPVRSAQRARTRILNSFLGWAAESLEMYLTVLNRKPKELVSEKFTELYSRAGQSIYKKTVYIGDEIQIDPVLIALMEVLITWRNHTLHYDIDNEIRDQSIVCLKQEANRIKDEYCGLDIEQLTTAWEQGRDFSFKEVASLISATHNYVNEVDTYAIKNISLERYYTDAVDNHLNMKNQSLQKLKSFPVERKSSYLKTLIENIVGDSNPDNKLVNDVLNNITKKHITSRSRATAQ